MSPIASKLILTLYNSKVLEATDKLEDAKAWATEILGDQNSAKYYLSPENFIVAYKNNDSFSFLIDRDSLYSQMYGPNAYFDDRCLWLSVTGSETDLAGKMKRGRGFQFWEVLTSKNNVPIELIDDAQEINAIIDEHAPDSSVRPGDPEELFWGGIRNELGELAALAVLVKWQSGFHVMASVATRSQDREKGYGTQLVLGMISRAHSLGIREIGLGVRTENISAQRVYEKAGFKKLAEFINYGRE